MASPKRILITTGDPDGIGWEVTAKALARLGPRKDTQFFFFRHVSAAKSAPSLARAFRREVYSSLEQAVAEKFDPKVAVEIRSAKPAALWVEDATKACLRKQFHALVTAPLSKTSIIQAGLRDIGHTEILARVSNAQDLFMGFLGAKFSVVLMTGHEPLARAVGGFTARKLQAGLKAGDQLRSLLPKAKRRLPMAVVGMNPHAGEQGLLGREESWMFRELERAESEFGQVAGPLVPDAAFLPPNWRKFSVYLCPYHDQGLIPFKMVHGFKSGVHLTLGLPFVRTSVDHGTAKDLFGKNKAEPGSMVDAIKTAMRLAQEN